MPPLLEVSSDHVGFTSKLASTIEEARSSVNDWVLRQKKKADEMEEVYNRNHREQQKNVDSLVADLLAVQLEIGLQVDHQDKQNINGESITKRQQTLKHQQAILRQEIDKLQAQLFHSQEQLQDLKDDQAQQQKRADDVSKRQRQAEESKNVTVEDLTRGLVNYKYLGLDFEKAEDDGLRFYFTQIDPSDPLRQFSFMLNANEFDNYEIHSTTPPSISSATMLRLTEQLNQTDDLVAFVCDMRKAFKETL